MKKYQRSKIFVFFAVVDISFLITCTDRTPVSPDEDTETQTVSNFSALLPLKVGNEWVYKYKNNSSGSTGSLSWKIIEKRDLVNQTVYLLKQTLAVTGLNRTLIISNKSRGIYVHAVINSTGFETTYSPPRPLMIFPLEIRASFTNWEGLKYVLKAEGKWIGTDAGMFKTLKYHIYKNDIEVGTWFWIKLIGPASMIANNPDPNSTISGGISTLSYFDIN